MELINEDRVKIKSSTKVFEGLDSLLDAVEYANENRSYYFVVYRKEIDRNTKKTNTVFYGYGVPK